jgi:hypothetical protein
MDWREVGKTVRERGRQFLSAYALHKMGPGYFKRMGCIGMTRTNVL